LNFVSFATTKATVICAYAAEDAVHIVATVAFLCVGLDVPVNLDLVSGSYDDPGEGGSGPVSQRVRQYTSRHAECKEVLTVADRHLLGI
jgi:hypothetical protein